MRIDSKPIWSFWGTLLYDARGGKYTNSDEITDW
jgi:hypothetical protein